MTYKPKRRRRAATPKPEVAAIDPAVLPPAIAASTEAEPPLVAEPAPKPPSETASTEVPSPTPKRRRRSTVGEHAMKLSAPARPGYRRRWFNDDGNRLATADELGYTPVSDTALKTSSPGSVVSRLTGTKANGEPLHSFLMETPDELFAEGMAEKEAQAAAIDQAIMSGRDSEGRMSQIPQDETYGQVSMKRDR